MHQSAAFARIVFADFLTPRTAFRISGAESSPGHVASTASWIKCSELPSIIQVNIWLIFAASVTGFAIAVTSLCVLSIVAPRLDVIVNPSAVKQQ